MFNDFLDYFSLIIDLLPNNEKKQLEYTEKTILRWIEKSSDAPNRDNESSKNSFFSKINDYVKVINLLNDNPSNTRNQILVPDTNALLIHPEISDYASLQNNRIVFFITPTVIAELDNHKMFHKNEDVRNKAKSIINRLKGYKKQGDIVNAGITINNTILLKMIPTEPNFNKTLNWLDQNNNDDRLIASILDIQVKHMSSEIKLITADLNLQNKATFAGIAYLDPDEIF